MSRHDRDPRTPRLETVPRGGVAAATPGSDPPAPRHPGATIEGLAHAHANARRQVVEQVQLSTGNALLARALDALPPPAPGAARDGAVLTISRAPATPKRRSNAGATGRIRKLGLKSFFVTSLSRDRHRDRARSSAPE